MIKKFLIKNNNNDDEKTSKNEINEEWATWLKV